MKTTHKLGGQKWTLVYIKIPLLYHISLSLSFLRTKQCECKIYKAKHNPYREEREICFLQLYKAKLDFFNIKT